MNNKHTKIRFWGFASCIVPVCVCVFFAASPPRYPSMTPGDDQVCHLSPMMPQWCCSLLLLSFHLIPLFSQICSSLYVCLLYLCVVVSQWSLVGSRQCVGKTCTTTFLQPDSNSYYRRRLSVLEYCTSANWDCKKNKCLHQTQYSLFMFVYNKVKRFSYSWEHGRSYTFTLSS